MEKYYIAYGSNMNLPQMARRCPDAKVIGAGSIKGWELTFRGYRNGAVATIEHKADSEVPILLWSISEADEASLDVYEGWPRLYRKEIIHCEVDGKDIEAMVYIMNKGREKNLPSFDYFGTILRGYRANGIDEKPLFDALGKTWYGVQHRDRPNLTYRW